jgi:hypothetical protein
VAYFFQNVVGEPVIGKEVLSRRTNEYQAWVEAFSRPGRCSNIDPILLALLA